MATSRNLSRNPLAPPPRGGAQVRDLDPEYHEALDRLYARTTGAWKLGLERVAALAGALGNPHLRYPVFHIAGTNGKGSTVATLTSLLRAAGFRVGRFTSPHLVDFRERIVVDERAIAPEATIEWLHRWEATAVDLGATFFETTAVMAFDYFASQEVDVAVIEVGLGGRLDATNIVCPVATGVTQIGFDHMEFLGNNLNAIAAEKAGIFKHGVPAIIGETVPEIQKVLVESAQSAGAFPVMIAGKDWSVSDISVDIHGTTFTLADTLGARRLHTSLIGEFQADNTATALAMLRSVGDQWANAANATEALHSVRLAGRFHRSERYLFDVAHNPDGARSLVHTIQHLGLPRPISALVTVLRDKDWRGILTELSAVANPLVLTCAPTAPPGRGWDLSAVVHWATDTGLAVVAEPDFDTALRAASGAGETVVVTGSFHTVGDAMERLQVDPLAR